MDIEDQKLMALEGIHTWALAIRHHVERLDRARHDMMQCLLKPASSMDEANKYNRITRIERHHLLISAYKLFEHARWAKELNYLDNSLFAGVEALGPDIKLLRDTNEHVIEYFKTGGKGRFPQNWWFEDGGGISDASATVEDRIGGRLSWHEVGKVADELSSSLPAHYWPPSSVPDGGAAETPIDNPG